GIAVLSVAIIVGGKKQEAGTSSSESTPGNAVASAEKTSFDEVTSKLDKGGSLYVYLSTGQWLQNLSGKVGSWKQFVDSITHQSDEDKQNIAKGFDVLTHVIKDSGIEDVSGVGMSSIAVEPGFYRTKSILHHYRSKGDGFLWNMLGERPHKLDGLDLLPA